LLAHALPQTIYHFTAFDVNGDRIMVTDINGREMPLTTDVAFVVK